MSPSMTQAMTEQGVLSPAGSCKTFDATADGFARGEAVNAILIKRLDDAIRDNNPIRAVIRSTAVNCDGKIPGMAYPSAESHEVMIRRAYKVASISDVSETAYVEYHDTGTQIGDWAETTTVANVFGERGVYIGLVRRDSTH
jgi:acyl transferase domain-containing protein